MKLTGRIWLEVPVEVELDYIPGEPSTSDYPGSEAEIWSGAILNMDEIKLEIDKAVYSHDWMKEMAGQIPDDARNKREAARVSTMIEEIKRAA